MTVSKDQVVSIDYTLKDDDGAVIDTSSGKDPLVYLHGRGQILPALESALDGKKQGDKIDIRLTPEQGYGVRNTDLQKKVERTAFPEGEISVGMQFQVDSDQGATVVTVIEASDEFVTIDGNHPLAGVPLNFSVEIKNMRDATAEELEHGHAHGPGGHQH